MKWSVLLLLFGALLASRPAPGLMAAAAGPSPEVNQQIFSHLVAGPGAATVFTVSNTGDSPASGTLSLTEQSGSPLLVTMTDSVSSTVTTGSSFPIALAGVQKFADDYHIFAVEWEPDQIRWYMDGNPYLTVKSADIPKGSKWVFDHSFFILLNVAVGGTWPGNPDATTVFPQKMLVDYVRVNERAQR